MLPAYIAQKYTDQQVRSILQNHGFVRIDGLHYQTTDKNGVIGLNTCMKRSGQPEHFMTLGVWNQHSSRTVLITLEGEIWVHFGYTKKDAWKVAGPRGKAEIYMPLLRGRHISREDLEKRRTNPDWQPSVAGRDAT